MVEGDERGMKRPIFCQEIQTLAKFSFIPNAAARLETFRIPLIGGLLSGVASWR